MLTFFIFTMSMFNVCYISYCQRLGIPTIALFLSILLSLGFPKNYLSERIYVLLAALSAVNHCYYTGGHVVVVVRHGGKETSCNLLKSWSFSGSVSLSCDPNKYFLAFFPLPFSGRGLTGQMEEE